MSETKKYNSACSISFEIDHENKEPTVNEIAQGMLKRVNNILEEIKDTPEDRDYLINEVVEVWDTVENNLE